METLYTPTAQWCRHSPAVPHNNMETAYTPTNPASPAVPHMETAYIPTADQEHSFYLPAVPDITHAHIEHERSLILTCSPTAQWCWARLSAHHLPAVHTWRHSWPVALPTQSCPFSIGSVSSYTASPPLAPLCGVAKACTDATHVQRPDDACSRHLEVHVQRHLVLQHACNSTSSCKVYT